MSQLVIKDVEDDVRRRLAERAAKSGRTIEEEAHAILSTSVASPRLSGKHLADLAGELFGEENGIELELPQWSVVRDAPKIGGR
jgi:plasmid stability protein